MNSLLLLAVLTSPPTVHCDSATVAAELIAAESQTGTLLFSRGDCLAVKVFTCSPYTHVAAVVYEDGGCYVYDSMNGIGVRRMSVAEYCRAECPNTLHVYHPRRAFPKSRLKKFVAHLQAELGREYDVMHHLTGKRAAGVHCAEYVTDALCACHLLRAERPSKVSPASLRDGIAQAELYHAAKSLDVHPRAPEAPEEASACGKLWHDTKHCTARFCRKLKGMFCCK